MKLLWATRAVTELRQACEYLEWHSEIAARQLAERIHEATDLLQTMPYMGRQGDARNTRELFVSKTNYFVTYEVSDATLLILSVRHTSRKWPLP